MAAAKMHDSAAVSARSNISLHAQASYPTQRTGTARQGSVSSADLACADSVFPRCVAAKRQAKTLSYGMWWMAADLQRREFTMPSTWRQFRSCQLGGGEKVGAVALWQSPGFSAPDRAIQRHAAGQSVADDLHYVHNMLLRMESSDCGLTAEYFGLRVLWPQSTM